MFSGTLAERPLESPQTASGRAGEKRQADAEVTRAKARLRALRTFYVPIDHDPILGWPTPSTLTQFRRLREEGR